MEILGSNIGDGNFGGSFVFFCFFFSANVHLLFFPKRTERCGKVASFQRYSFLLVPAEVNTVQNVTEVDF